MINRFTGVVSKQQCMFLCFDIFEFYNSISEKLLDGAMDFASQHTNISRGDKEIVFHSRKSLLFNKNHARLKKTKDDPLLDVPVVCELIGTFIQQVEVTGCRMYSSKKVYGTMWARLTVVDKDESKVLEPDFWPQDVSARRWEFRDPPLTAKS